MWVTSARTLFLRPQSQALALGCGQIFRGPLLNPNRGAGASGVAGWKCVHVETLPRGCRPPVQGMQVECTLGRGVRLSNHRSSAYFRGDTGRVLVTGSVSPSTGCPRMLRRHSGWGPLPLGALAPSHMRAGGLLVGHAETRGRLGLWWGHRPHCSCPNPVGPGP